MKSQNGNQMTHDELLASIIDYGQNGPIDYGQIDLSKALRAVVELHKPIFRIVEVSQTKSGIEAGMKQICQLDEIHYPCPTIQAIEKELG